MLNKSTSKRIKLPRCKACRCEFVKERVSQEVCNDVCALAWIKIKNEKEVRIKAKRERMDDRERRESLKTLNDYYDEAQVPFNQFTVLRDRYEPCISCRRFHQGKWNAGHYRGRKAMSALRFDEDNVHKQCEPCNSNLAGNIIEYRLHLRLKIGDERLARLEFHHPPLEMTKDQAIALRRHYEEKVKELKKQYSEE